MKTPKAVKLKSGSWRVQIQIDGKRHSCTGKTKKEAQDKARQIFAGNEIEKRIPLTVGKAIDNYISEKEGVLSPSTIRGYKAIRKNYLQSLMDLNISDLSQNDIQLAVGEDSIDGKSPKTIRNAHGLLTATLKEYRPNFHIDTKLPQKRVHEAHIFTEDEMKKVWKAAEGTNYELPILFASWLGLRVSEIIALKYGDISSNGKIHIQRARVPNSENELVEKAPKTIAGDRWITLPSDIRALIDKKRATDPNANEKSYIIPMTRAAVYSGFRRICRKAKVVPCKFHELRHFAASEAHAIGVPDKYSMKRMGHSTDVMLKTVYQHTLQKKEDEFGSLIDQKMAELFDGAHEKSSES